MTPRLHYAPDNASLCIRLAFEMLEAPYTTTLVDRRNQAQRSDAYRVLNPNGLIPVLETEDGPIFETGAILLWQAQRYPGQLMPAPGTSGEGRALSWLFWLSNTLHPALRMTFYPDRYMPEAACALRKAIQGRVADHLRLIDGHTDALSPVHVCYLSPMLRWLALYGDNAGWFDLSGFPNLHDLAKRFEATPAAQRAAKAEGLGETPFSDPRPATPPEGSAT